MIKKETKNSHHYQLKGISSIQLTQKKKKYQKNYVNGAAANLSNKTINYQTTKTNLIIPQHN